MTTQEIIEVIKGLSVLELNDLVKACEEEFGVSAAAGVVAVSYTHLNFLGRCSHFMPYGACCLRRSYFGMISWV